MPFSANRIGGQASHQSSHLSSPTRRGLKRCKRNLCGTRRLCFHLSTLRETGTLFYTNPRANLDLIERRLQYRSISHHIILKQILHLIIDIWSFWRTIPAASELRLFIFLHRSLRKIFYRRVASLFLFFNWTVPDPPRCQI